jgi:hypothetical protein
MEEIVSLYERLRDPACQEADAITTSLMEFYKNPESLGILFQIITTSQNEQIRIAATIGIGSFVRSCWREIEDKSGAYSLILQLSVFAPSSEVRRLNTHYINSCLSVELLPVITSFIETISAEMTPLHAEVICMLAALSINYGLEIPSEEAAIAACMQDASPLEAKYSAIRLLFNRYNLSEEEEASDESQTFFVSSLDVLKAAATSGNINIVKSMVLECYNYSISDEANFINYEELLKAVIEIMQNTEIPKQIRSWTHILCNEIIDSQKNAILGSEFNEESIGFNLYSIYTKYVVENGITNEIYTENNDDLSVIASTLANKEDFLQYVWEIASNIEDENTLFIVLETIINTFGNGARFYTDKLEQLFELYASSLGNENVAIVSLTIESIIIMSTHLGKVIGESSTSLIGLLVQYVSAADDQELIPDVFRAINSLVTNFDDTDSVFDDIAGSIIQLLESSFYNQNVLECLATIVSKSNEKSAEHYEQLIQSCYSLISSADEEVNIIKPLLIKCVSLIGSKNPELFQESAQEFVETIIPTIENDDFAYESIKAYGRIVEAFPDAFSEFSDSILPQFIAICKSDLSPPENSDAEFMGEDDLALDDLYDAMLKRVSAALRIVCVILKSYPDKIPALEEEVFASFENIATCSLLPNTMINLAESIVLFAEGLSKLGNPEEHAAEAQKLIEIIAPTFETILDQYATGKIFEAICEVVCYFTVAPLFANSDTAELVLESTYKTLELQDEYIEYFHENASRVVRELLDQMHNDAFQYISKFLPLYESCLQNDDVEFHNLALQFYGDFIANCNEHVEGELVGTVIDLAITAIKERNSPLGFTALKQIAKVFPDALSEHLEVIIQLIIEKLDPSVSKTDENMSLQDNAVSLLGKIAINIHGDSFNLQQFMPLVAPAMPAQMDVEENPDIMEFFLWIVEKSGGQFTAEICGVLARVFSDTRDDLLSWYFTEELLEQLHGLFVQYIQAVGDVDAFIASIVGGNEAKAQNIRAALA